eukprot:SAG31_NODE_25396_length_462_cov_0.859504_1_plen_48_part_01
MMAAPMIPILSYATKNMKSNRLSATLIKISIAAVREDRSHLLRNPNVL